MDIWFFFLFIFVSSLSLRKVIDYFPVERTSQRTLPAIGGFNEYAGIYVYISDIFLTLAILCWVVSIIYTNYRKQSSGKLWITHPIHTLYTSLKNNVPRLPRGKSFYSAKYANVPRGTLLGNKTDVKQFFLRGGTLFIAPMFLVIWSFISISWAKNESIALFRSFKLLEFYLLYLFVASRLIPLFHVEQSEATQTKIAAIYPNQLRDKTEEKNVPRGTFSIFLLSMVFLGLFQSFIAIWQFISQYSVGLFWLKESLISPDIPGVAKIILNGHKIIRAYGLFPHPNILGGFLLFSTIATLLYKNCSTWNINAPLSSIRKRIGDEVIVPRGTINPSSNSPSNYFWLEKLLRRKPWFIDIAISIQLFALISTFSKSAILGLIIALTYLHVPRGTIHKYPSGTQNHSPFSKKVVLILGILVLSLYLAKPDLNILLAKSLKERIFYLNVSPAIVATQHIAGARGTIEDAQKLLFGVGAGQFVLNIPNYTSQVVEQWQFQPVHNVFLLIWSELGLIGLVLFLWFLWTIFSKSILENKYDVSSNVVTLHYFKAILLGFIFIMLFDHYSWDIQQGSLLLWMTLGIIAGVKRKC